MEEFTELDKLMMEKAKKLHEKLLQKVKSEWSGGDGFNEVTKEVYDYRLNICRKCEFWQEDHLRAYGKCLKCGCSKNKYKLPYEKCPIGLWGEVEQKLIDKNK